MPRAPNGASVDQVIERAVQSVVSRASNAFNRALDRAIAERVRGELARARSQSSPARRGRSRRRSPIEMTKWVADRRARRVPKFVIAATGLKTKKEIVAKYGPDSKFEKGKPLPKAK